MKNKFSPVGENSFDSVIHSSLPTKRESKRFKPVPSDAADEVNSSTDNDFGEHNLFVGASQRE